MTIEDFGSTLKCCWMLAGVVSYKLCDRLYECETCDFDRAIRSPGQARSSGRETRPRTLPDGGRLVENLFDRFPAEARSRILDRFPAANSNASPDPPDSRASGETEGS